MLPEMCRSRANTAWDQAYRQRAYDDSRADTAWDQAYRTGEIGPKTYAYGSGEPYEIGSGKGLSFLSGAAPGQIMTGGDGSVWVKNADGSVTITRGRRPRRRAAAAAGAGAGAHRSPTSPPRRS